MSGLSICVFSNYTNIFYILSMNRIFIVHVFVLMAQICLAIKAFYSFIKDVQRVRLPLLLFMDAIVIGFFYNCIYLLPLCYEKQTKILNLTKSIAPIILSLSLFQEIAFLNKYTRTNKPRREKMSITESIYVALTIMTLVFLALLGIYLCLKVSALLFVKQNKKKDHEATGGTDHVR